ncbi:receptor expression-enhancing protein 4 isoform X2 [Agelaius tricolor]|uniref:receptor expression-enhancing protein 4 isoform X2 n=1 Tax=Agelaius tricolor TaxID=9191 RepID=UPI0039F225B0
MPHSLAGSLPRGSPHFPIPWQEFPRAGPPGGCLGCWHLPQPRHRAWHRGRSPRGAARALPCPDRSGRSRGPGSCTVLMAEPPRSLPGRCPGLGSVLGGLQAGLQRRARRLCWAGLLLLYAGWPSCLTPALRYRLLFGMLYPAYASYKAVKTKNIREYVRWMMYWIIFALFMTTETFTDLLISWLPFYYEVKMAFVIWLLSPYTRGASLLYRRFVHPTLARREKDIDAFLVRARERGYETALSFGKRGLNLAATAAVQAATKSQGALAGRLRSFSVHDLRSLPEQAPVHFQDPLYLEEQGSLQQPLGLRYESESDEEELWSDSQVSPSVSPCRGARPLSRWQSLRTLRKNPGKEGSSRLLRSRTRRRAALSEQES